MKYLIGAIIAVILITAFQKSRGASVSSSGIFSTVSALPDIPVDLGLLIGG